MRTPAFWSSKNLLSNLLLPIATLYEIATTLQRTFIKPVTLPVPVICVGNAVAGGAGKTPVALHIGQILKDKGVAAFFISRGYGGTLQGPVLVDARKHSAQDVGDEPLLLADILPTVVAKDRISGARFAIEKGAKAIILDDGFQNPALAKTLSLLVVNGHSGLGNGRLLPAGPMRESFDTALKRAHAIIVIDRSTLVPPLPGDKPVLAARTQPTGTLSLKNQKIVAFSGIAAPQKFFATLSSLGADIKERIAFADHHPYTPQDIRNLVTKANQHQAALVTTAKDAVRLPAAFREQVAILEIALAFDNPPLLENMLAFALDHAKS